MAVELSEAEKLEEARASVLRVTKEINAATIDRDTEVRLGILALVSREHMLMLGPPGTAKTLVATYLGRTTESGKFFEILLSKFTTPDEVFGPVSVKELISKERHFRKTDGYLPWAETVMLDEALAIDTPIPTPTGWTAMGDLKAGDYVLGADGKPTKVVRTTAIVPGDCYRVTFNDKTEITADAGHLWMVKRPDATSPWRVMSTKQLVDDGGEFLVRESRPCELPEADLTVDPYVLGVWLGNGNSWNAEVYIREDWADRSAELFREAGYAANVREKRGKLVTFSFTDTGLRAELRKMGLINEGVQYEGSLKAIPRQYLRGSIGQRLRLIQGLMDTDGSMTETGTCVFSNTNEDIIDGLVELVRSLGIRCVKSPMKDERVGATGQHKPCWRVTFHADQELRPFLAREVSITPNKKRMGIRISSILPTANTLVRCIEVEAEDHLFLAGKAWRVTHNCFKGSSAILNTLLTAINERKFDNGGQRVAIPLGSIFGASNELPQDDVLAALYDRFLIRTEVQPVSNPLRLLDVDRLPKPKSKLLHLNTLRAAVPGVVLPTNVRQAAASIKSLAEAAGAKVGDRRFRLSANLIRASAAISGRTVASANDLWPLSYCYWTTPDQIPTITRATRTAMDQAGAQRDEAPTFQSEPESSPGSFQGAQTTQSAYQNLVAMLRSNQDARAKMLAATVEEIRKRTPDAIKADPKLCTQIRALAETAPPPNKKVRPNAADPDHLVKLTAGRI